MTKIKKGYWVVNYIAIMDSEKLKAYREIGFPAVLAAGGKAIIRSVAEETHENGVVQPTTVIEFKNLQTALTCFHSKEYQSAIKLGAGGFVRDFRIIEGV